MAICRHVFICRPPKILGWRSRVHGTAYILLPLGLFSLPPIYWPFQGTPQAGKHCPWTLVVAPREDRDSGKAEKAYIHHKQNSGMDNV